MYPSILLAEHPEHCLNHHEKATKRPPGNKREAKGNLLEIKDPKPLSDKIKDTKRRARSTGGFLLKRNDIAYRQHWASFSSLDLDDMQEQFFFKKQLFNNTTS